MRNSSVTHIPTTNNERAESGLTLRPNNLSVLEGRNNSELGIFATAHSTARGNNGERKAFGFRNHSHALGSTVKHF